MSIRIILLTLIICNLIFAETEPNDTCTQANYIEINSTSNGNVSLVQIDKRSYTIDFDYWFFTVPTNGIVHVYTTNATENIDAALYNSNCTSLLIYDSTNDNNIDIKYFVTANSTYKLLLYESSIGESNYTLHIDFTTPVTTVFNDGERSFTIVNPENTRNISGGVLITGNTIECVTEETWDFDGICTNDHTKNDNNYAVKYIDIDDDNRTWNSSSAYIKLPDDFQEVVWAGLFWQGNINGEPDNYYYPQRHQRRAVPDNLDNWTYIYNQSNYGPLDIRTTDANKIWLKIEGMNDYQTIIADTMDYYNWYGIYGSVYSSYANITSIVKNYLDQHKPGDLVTITAANLSTNEGRETSLGDYGAWTLSLVYKGNEKSKFKRVLVYNGYKIIALPTNPIESITIDNLYLPQSGDVLSTYASFAGEGEELYYPDHMKLNGQNMPGARDPNNIFDARLANIERPAIGDNNVTNTNGIDIDVYDVSSIMTDIRNSNPSTSSVEISLDTGGDAYFPSMIAFEVQLYQPKICYEETLYDSNGNEINGSNNTVEINSTITAKLIIRNDDNEIAENVQIMKVFDQNITRYYRNSTQVKDVDWEDLIRFDDNQTINGVTVRYTDNNLSIGPLGEGSTVTQFLPYASNPNEIATIEYNFSLLSNSQPVSLTYNTSYIFTIAGHTFTFDGPLPKCSDFNNTIIPYQPPLGSFNVVNENFTGTNNPTDSNSSLNSLYTQIVDKEFNVKVLHVKEDNSTLEPTSGVVFFDIVDASTIHDVQTCANAPILYSLPGKTYRIFFGDSNPNTQTSIQTLSNIKIPVASKNATFRIKYIDWSQVIQNSGVQCADVSDMSANLPGVPACLDSGTQIDTVFPGNLCRSTSTGAPCLPENHGQGNPPYDHQYGCAQCLTDYHPFYVCARDNFAIRPDRFVMEANETNLIGKRWYHLEINATHYGSDLNASRYTQLIDNSVDKNATMKLVVPSGCSLSPSTQLFSNSIAFTDGQSNQPTLFRYDNVGNVQVTIVDNDWTKVDQRQKSDGSIDCIEANATNIPNLGKIGCLIEGDHNFTFNPKAFESNLTLQNFNNSQFTYISNDDNMSSNIQLTITALLDDNSPATNYTANCYAKDINYTVTLINDKNLTWSTAKQRIKFYDDSTSSNLVTSSFGLAEFNSSQSQFISGVANPVVKFNFDRNVSIADNPFIISRNDFNISVQEIGGTTYGSDFNRSYDNNATFYYGRAISLDKTIQGNSANTFVYFEVYDANKSDPAGIEGNESLMAEHWYINNNHNTQNQGQVLQLLYKGNDIKNSSFDEMSANLGTLSNGKEPLKLTYDESKDYPFTAKIDINASSWLVYNKYDENATTVPFEITFTNNTNWKGAGYFEDNGTNENRVYKKPLQRIQW